MLTTVKSAGILGINAYLLDVEVDIAMAAMPKWYTVGLADSEVKESKERVVSAIKNTGYDFVQRKITINLAPADVKKEGTAFDMPIALGLLASSGMISQSDLTGYLCLGELSLNGDLRPIKGALPIAVMAARDKFRGILLPLENALEAATVSGIKVYGIENLSEAVEFLNHRIKLTPTQTQNFEETPKTYAVDFSDICGQYQAKRSLEVAASGGHNLLFIGSPGAGKSLMSSRLPTILPPLTFQESLETSRIYSVMDLLRHQNKLLVERPFRSPHHSISDAGLIGGGSHPRPGEVSLAHNGVLFLDELPEFKKNVLEVLRQPLENHEVTISRASMSLTYPASFMMVVAMNPCPCGYHGHPRTPCVCTPSQIQRYRAKISGPLLDRIDLQIEVPPVSFDEMSEVDEAKESSHTIRQRVIQVRRIQQQRFKKSGMRLNAQMGPADVKAYCQLNKEGKDILKGIMDKFHLSGRAYDRILKMSRTLADMEGAGDIATKHLLEAVQYRSLDRFVL